MSGNYISKIPVLVVALVIGIVLVTSAVVPLASNYSDAKTFKNEGVFNYGIFKPTDTYTFTYAASTGELTINGESVTVPGVDLTHFNSYSVLASDDWLFRYGANNSGYYLQVVGKDSGGNTLLSGGVTCTATIDEGVLKVQLTGSDNTVTNKTLGFTEFYSIVPDEDVAVMKISNQAVYIKGDSPLYGSGLTTVSAWNNAFHFEGTYDDGITISSPNLSAATFDNITWNIEPVDGYIDLYKLTSIEFDITNNDTTVHATYSYFGVPSEVTADPDNPAAYKNLVKVVPLMAFIMLVVAAAGMVYFKNKD